MKNRQDLIDTLAVALAVVLLWSLVVYLTLYLIGRILRALL